MKFKWIRAYVRAVQRVLAAVLLFFSYILGIGITSVLVRIFDRKSFGIRDEGQSSFWVEAKGYGHEDHDVTRQS